METKRAKRSEQSENIPVAKMDNSVSPGLCLHTGYDAVTSPLERFPLVVWDEILSYLTDKEDLENAYNASPKMYEVFSTEYKTSLLLGEVLGILTRPRPIKKKKKEDETEQEKLALELEPGYIGGKDLLNLRLISKMWDKTVCTFISEHESHVRLETIMRPEYKLAGDTFAKPNCSILPPLVVKQRIRFSVELGRSTCPGQPSIYSFVNRSLLIQIPAVYHHFGAFGRRVDGQIDNRLEPRIFFQQHGQHIWYCTFIFRRATIPPAIHDQYLMIVRCLRSMPNLRKLVIIMDADSTLSRNSSQGVPLEETIHHNRCPTLEDLVLFKSENLASEIFDEILLRNRHIPKLSIDYTIDSRKGSYDLTVEAPEELCLSIYNCPDISLLEDPRGRRNVTIWPLTKLCLHFEKDRGPSFMPWEGIFRTIEQFSPTLLDLTLKLPRAITFEQKKLLLQTSINSRLYLPLVKKLRLTLTTPSSIDFLLEMQESLEDLIIVIDHCDENVFVSEEEIIKFQYLWKRLDTSNIWEYFPKLQGNLEVAVREDHRFLTKYNRWDFKHVSYREGKLVS